MEVKSLDPGRCQERVYDETGWHPHQCSRKPVAGGVFCRIHSPEYKAEKRAKRDAAWKETEERWKTKRAREEAQDAFVAAARALAADVKERGWHLGSLEADIFLETFAALVEAESLR